MVTRLTPRRPRASPVGSGSLPLRALLGLLREAPVRSVGLPPAVDLDDAAWQGLLVLAAEHRLTSWLAVRLSDRPGVPPDIAAQLRTYRKQQALRQLRMAADLARIGPSLDAAGVSWMVIKGPALAATAFEFPEEREYGDVDLLVAPRQLGACLQALEAAGGVVLDRNWSMIRRTDRGELTVLLSLGSPLDLHWSLLNTPALRRTFRLDTDTLFRRHGWASSDGVAFPVLDPLDEVIYVALHAVLAGAHKLVWSLDIAQLARRTRDWDAVVARARASGTALALAVGLSRAAAITGVTVPTGVLQALGDGAPWSRLLHRLDAADLTDPEGRLPAWLAGPHSRRLVAASTRSSSFSSSTALGRATLAEAVPRWLGRPFVGDDIEELRRDEPAERDVFLASLAHPRR